MKSLFHTILGISILLAALVAAQSGSTISIETSSMMDFATVSDYQMSTTYSKDSMRATDLNFKTAWQCDETETVDKEVTIYLMTSKTIRTVFVANSAESEDA